MRQRQRTARIRRRSRAGCNGGNPALHRTSPIARPPRAAGCRLHRRRAPARVQRDVRRLRASRLVNLLQVAPAEGGPMKIATPRARWMLTGVVWLFGCDTPAPLHENLGTTHQQLGDIDSLDKVDQYALGCYDELGV